MHTTSKINSESLVKRLMCGVLPVVLLLFAQQLVGFIGHIISKSMHENGNGYGFCLATELDRLIPYQYDGGHFIYTWGNNIFLFSIGLLIYVFKGQKVFYDALFAFFSSFLVFMLIIIFIPTYDYDSRLPDVTPDWDNGMTFPSGHNLLIGFMLYMARKNLKHKSDGAIFVYSIVGFVSIAMSTLFTKQHYLLDILLTAITFEAVALICRVYRSRYQHSNFLMTADNSIYYLLGIYKNVVVSPRVSRARVSITANHYALKQIILVILGVAIIAGMLGFAASDRSLRM